MLRQHVVLAILALSFVAPGVYAQKVYWTDGAWNIWRADLDGSNKELLGNWANASDGGGGRPFIVDDVTGKICWLFNGGIAAPHGIYCANSDLTDEIQVVPGDWNNSTITHFDIFSPPASTVPPYSDWSLAALLLIILVAATLTLRGRRARAE